MVVSEAEKNIKKILEIKKIYLKQDTSCAYVCAPLKLNIDLTFFLIFLQALQHELADNN